MLKWKPWANVMGLDSQYRLDRLSGRYQDIEQELHSTRSVHALSGGDSATVLPGNITVPWKLSVWDMARRYRRHIDAVDTLYGGATYMPMADGAKYEVWITQSGLVARPVNVVARQKCASAGGWSRGQLDQTVPRVRRRARGWTSFWLITTVWPRKRSMIERT